MDDEPDAGRIGCSVKKVRQGGSIPFYIDGYLKFGLFR
jgi:hypothetical protein